MRAAHFIITRASATHGNLHQSKHQHILPKLSSPCHGNQSRGVLSNRPLREGGGGGGGRGDRPLQITPTALSGIGPEKLKVEMACQKWRVRNGVSEIACQKWRVRNGVSEMTCQKWRA